MFMTYIAITLIAAAIIIFTPSDINLEKDIPVIKARVGNINEYVLDLENVTLERALQASARKALIGLINHVNQTSQFFSSELEFKEVFSQVLLNGSYHGNLMGNMTNNTYNDWLTKIRNNAQNTFNVDTFFAVSNVQIYQVKPWFVNVDADVEFNVSSESVFWTKNVTIKSEISVENFNDPYYLVKTNGAYLNKIRQSGAKFNEWNVTKVKDFIRDGNYTHFGTSQAPNFLMRFYNDVSASECCGIESIVNPNNAAISDNDVSYVDYLYWSTVLGCNDLNLYTENSASGINSEFPNIKFDWDHVVLYRLLQDPLADVQQICPQTP